jgi:hypothetical protein
MNKIVPIGILIYFLFGSSFLLIKKVEQPKEPIIQIKLAHLVKDRVLQLDSVKYINSLGQVFTISKFKYYISNIHLNSSKLPKKEGFNAYLIDEEDSASKNIFLKMGEEGFLIQSNNSKWQTDKIAALNQNPKDVSGAGDTFLSGLVVEYIRTKDIEKSIIFAQQCATVVVQKKGVSTI